MKLMDYLMWEDVSSDRLNFYRAIGVESMMVHLPEEMGDGEDHTEDFKQMKKFVEEHGLERQGFRRRRQRFMRSAIFAPRPRTVEVGSATVHSSMRS